MKKNHVISTVRFLEYGKKAPKGSRFKGTINTESLIGWISYTDRKQAADQKKEMSMHDGGLIGYTSQNESIRTFSSDGWLDEKKMKAFKEKIADSFNKKGNLCWDTVVSLRDYQDAFDAGMVDINDYASIVAKTLPSYFKSIGLDRNNMIWWMDYHNNKDNPHMHIVFLEQHQTKTKGKLPQKAIDKYKSLWLKELGMRQEFKKEFGKDAALIFKEKDILKKNFMERAKENLVLDTKLEKLKAILPKQGRFSYNSLNMKPYKGLMDEIIKNVLNTADVKPQFEKWMNIVDTFDKFQNNLAGDDISHLKETEMEKLYTNMGNMILKELKTDRFSKMKSNDLWFRESFILAKDQDKVVIKIPHAPLTAEINRNQIFLDDNKTYHVDLSKENSFSINRYSTNMDAWDKRNPKSQKILNGHEMEHYLNGINEGSEKATDRDQSMSGSVLKTVISKDESKKEKSNRSSIKSAFGIKNRNRKYYKENYSSMIKKGTRRLLHQDEQEKERDLEKFINEVEKQQIRVEERGNEL